MTWKSVEKKMNWVNRQFVPHMMVSDPNDERWTQAIRQWAEAYEALYLLEKLVKEAESE